jgi:FkbM family methyltransferase
MSNSYIYPNGKTIQITQETRTVNNHTWEGFQNYVYETNSIKHVFDKLSEIAQKNGSARLLDIGAQSGLYSLYSKYFDKVFVDAFEPFPQSYKCLVDNIKLNGIEDKVTPYQIAISNTCGKTVLRSPPDHTGLNTLGATPLRFNNWYEVEVETNTIDNLYKNIKIDFIKCDTEGWEYFVIMGGLSVIKRDSPQLLLEVHETNMKQCDIQLENFQKLINIIGYKLEKIIDNENYAFYKA